MASVTPAAGEGGFAPHLPGGPTTQATVPRNPMPRQPSAPGIERVGSVRILRASAGWSGIALRLANPIGLAAGFMEPLESQSIHLIQVGISRLMTLFPTKEFRQVDIDRYNRLLTFEYEKIRDFLKLHYHVTQRDDTDYWRYLRNMQVSDYLADKIELFERSGRVFRENDELFNDTSWYAVMMGQGLKPGGYDPLVDVMPEPEFQSRMAQIKAAIRASVDWMPTHMDFIKQHCAAPPHEFQRASGSATVSAA